MKTVTIIAIIFAIIFIVGIPAAINYVASLEPQAQTTPENQLANYFNIFSATQNLHLTYDFHYPGLVEQNVSLYKLNNAMKLQAPMIGASTTALYYLISDKEAVCSSNATGGIICYGGLVPSSSQTLFAPVEFLTITPDLKNVGSPINISTGTSKQILGRPCDDFVMILAPMQAEAIRGMGPDGYRASSFNITTLTYEVCIDRQYGFVALGNFSEVMPVSGQTPINLQLALFEATKFSSDVTASDVALPTGVTG